MKHFEQFTQDETGLELSEYALAAALIALAVVVAFQALGGSIIGALNALAAIITTS